MLAHQLIQELLQLNPQANVVFDVWTEGQVYAIDGVIVEGEKVVLQQGGLEI